MENTAVKKSVKLKKSYFIEINQKLIKVSKKVMKNYNFNSELVDIYINVLSDDKNYKIFKKAQRKYKNRNIVQ